MLLLAEMLPASNKQKQGLENIIDKWTQELQRTQRLFKECVSDGRKWLDSSDSRIRDDYDISIRSLGQSAKKMKSLLVEYFSIYDEILRNHCCGSNLMGPLEENMGYREIANRAESLAMQELEKLLHQFCSENKAPIASNL